ncbi:TPA: sodium:calcium antiporter [Candidatus Micrarchaeota archaeon]|nr:MAG: hypothetical protein AUJ65_04210 [Candidatus Micrarchaeota archaeon CG1_02_51_15]HII38463.1 sodium:calcium antiporter [Candidatus Micrarchaeota archaeon]
MIETLALLVISLLVLYYASNWLITHAINLARFFKIGEMEVGFLLVAVATSLPELVISVLATLQGNTGLAVGNILGANIADLCLVLGIAALFGGIVVKRKEMKDLTAILLAASVLPLVIMLNWFNGFEAVALLSIFAAFAYFMLKKRVSIGDGETVSARQAVTSAFLFTIGLVLILISSNYAVDLAVVLAGKIGASNAFVGATIVALGTTLPELAVSVAAVKRKHSALAVGSILGSCITNLTLVMGVAAVINPLTANVTAFTNLVAFMCISSVLVWYFIQRDHKLERPQGIVLLILYAIFLISAFRAEKLILP